MPSRHVTASRALVFLSSLFLGVACGSSSSSGTSSAGDDGGSSSGGLAGDDAGGSGSGGSSGSSGSGGSSGSSSGGSSSSGSSSGGLTSDGGQGDADTAALDAGPQSDLQKAQAFLANQKMGVCVERSHWTDLSYNGKPIASDASYWKYLASLGITLVHFEIPFGVASPGFNQSQSDVQGFMSVVSAALNGGLSVTLNLMDITALSDATSNAGTFTSYLTMAAGVVASMNFDKTRIAIGSAEEFVGDSNATWNATMHSWLGTLRAALPGYILISAAANWDYYGGPGAMNDYDNGTGLGGDGSGGDPFTPLDDMLVIYDVHDYDAGYFAGSSNKFSQVQINVAAWQAKNGNRPVYVGEIGGTPGAAQYAPWSASDILPLAQGCGQLAPSPWAITSGGTNVNSSSTDGTLPAVMEEAYKSAASFITSQSYFGNGSIR